jgi:hypothetical protein
MCITGAASLPASWLVAFQIFGRNVVLRELSGFDLRYIWVRGILHAIENSCLEGLSFCD